MTVRANRLARLASWIAQVLAGVAAVLVIADIWGFNLLAWTTTPLGARLLAGVMRLGLLAVATVAVFEVVSLAIGRGMDGFADHAVEPRRRAQLATLAPLLRGVAQTAIVIVAILMALSELGVKIGPFLAGAGVVGVVLKARIKTQPLQHWNVGREYNRRIKLAFDEAGVEIPFPHLKVVMPERQVSELAGLRAAAS